jgi:ribosomal protein S18 acetylase RimI-like enzyme
MDVRAAVAAELDVLAQIWHDAWHEAHAHLVPAELTRLRTLENFRERLNAALPQVRVVGPSGEPFGFCIVKGDELDHLFVSTKARGSGAATVLVADAEARMAQSGVKVAWLACAIGNERAARFYEKCGWRRTGTIVHLAKTSQGDFPLEAWRYEKSLAGEA